MCGHTPGTGLTGVAGTHGVGGVVEGWVDVGVGVGVGVGYTLTGAAAAAGSRHVAASRPGLHAATNAAPPRVSSSRRLNRIGSDFRHSPSRADVAMIAP